MIKSIYYHNPSAEGFEFMIKWFKRFDYSFISLNELTSCIQDNEHKYVIFSLDDGWKGNLKLIPIAEKYNVPLLLFITYNALIEGNFWWEYVAAEVGYSKLDSLKQGNYNDLLELIQKAKELHQLKRSALTIDECIELSQHPLITIGSHTLSHPLLDKIPLQQLQCELSGSKLKLEELLGFKINAFSYPNGNYSTEVVDECGQHYQYAFTTVAGQISSDTNPLLLPRVALTGHKIKDLLKVYGIWKYIKPLKHII